MQLLWLLLLGLVVMGRRKQVGPAPVTIPPHITKPLDGATVPDRHELAWTQGSNIDKSAAIRFVKDPHTGSNIPNPPIGGETGHYGAILWRTTGPVSIIMQIDYGNGWQEVDRVNLVIE
jgi:hypothetical protein